MRAIVVVHEDPDLAVQHLYDADVIGLPISICYILQCAWHHTSPGTFNAPFQDIPIKEDPWFQWVLESQANYAWLWEYAMDIVDEHFHRFGSRAVSHYRHGSSNQLDKYQSMPPLPQIEQTPFPQTVEDMLHGYKSRTGFWVEFTNREKPEWAATIAS